MLNRREFLTRGLSYGSLLMLPRVSWAAGDKKQPGHRTLVLLHLRGGNDGLNTVIPYNDPLYRVLRPGIGIGENQIRKIDKNVGLHPAMGGFESLWKRERLAIVQGVGYPLPNYSHFRATEIYYSGEPEKTPSSGWMGRALEARPSERPLRAVAIEKEKPLSLASSAPGIVSLTNFKQFQLPKEARESIAMYKEFLALGGERAAVAKRALEAFKVAEKIASLRPVRGSFYGSLGQDLSKVLALLQTDLDLEVICLSLNGFDTHANQGPQHNGLLAQLSNNLRAYQDLLERQGLGDRVCTFVFSEFGRRATENLSGGTDHGSAYPAFVLGKGVKPGLYGEAPSLENLDNNNLRYTTDFRRIYGGLLKGCLGLDPKPILGDHAPLELLA